MLDLAAAVLVSMAIGWFWYHPATFGDVWCRLAHSGKTPAQVEKDTSRSLSLCLSFCAVGHLVSMYVIQTLFRMYIGTWSVEVALQLSGLLSVLNWSTEIPHFMFGAKPVGLFLIDMTHDSICLIVGSVVMALLQ